MSHDWLMARTIACNCQSSSNFRWRRGEGGQTSLRRAGRMVRMTLEGAGVVKVRHHADGEAVVKTKLMVRVVLPWPGMMGTLGMLTQHAGIKVKTGA